MTLVSTGGPASTGRSWPTSTQNLGITRRTTSRWASTTISTGSAHGSAGLLGPELGSGLPGRERLPGPAPGHGQLEQLRPLELARLRRGHRPGRRRDRSGRRPPRRSTAEAIVQRDVPVIPVAYGTGDALARDGLLGAPRTVSGSCAWPGSRGRPVTAGAAEARPRPFAAPGCRSRWRLPVRAASADRHFEPPTAIAKYGTSITFSEARSPRPPSPSGSSCS